ncbi:ESX secretion-associated protein EspG [Nocardia blacklockiae]|uniref:ESX secretion-associated protein EspG n=1 Tax=Nocardia blacklockiae TaxID=480036 RepID=UPI0018953581|nr:ESX secretion-associated protein EspG [Nocardia blacklockiae]MBF6171398.1 ESX secretion-associated protein EspG [Nocardia blacklockiae]
MTALTNDSLLAVADRLGVQTLPLALSIGPRQDSFDEFRAAQERAVADLTAVGVIDPDGDVDPDLAAALFTLSQPEYELALRVYGEGGTRRACLVRRGAEHAVAVRVGDRVEVRSAWVDGSGAALAAPLLAVLDSVSAAEVASLSAPTDELAARLNAAGTVAEYTDAMYALGAAERDATVLGSAFGSCHTYAEIVASTHHDGLTTRVPGTVAIYDTARGRIVVAPMVAPDRQVWSTVTPGTDHRVAQAITALIDGLPGGRWLPR